MAAQHGGNARSALAVWCSRAKATQDASTLPTSQNPPAFECKLIVRKGDAVLGEFLGKGALQACMGC
jgi:hypothetical protein